MKRLLKGISLTSIFCAMAFFCGQASAKPLVLVSKLTGNAFSVFNDATKQLREGDYLDDFSTVMTEEGATISLSDFHDHKYHLAGSGMIKMYNGILEVLRGYVLIQSFGTDAGVNYRLQTSNAISTYTHGDAVISFDPLAGRTELLVLNGKFEFKNSIHDDLGVTLQRSEFSFVDNNYDKGIPRLPTRIGEKSYGQISSMFSKFLSDEYKYAQTKNVREESIFRGVASVSSADGVSAKESGATAGGKIIYRRPYERKQFDLDSYYSKKVTKIDSDRINQKFRPEYSVKTGVAVKIYGNTSRSIASIPSSKKIAKERSFVQRKPASILINPQVTISQDATTINVAPNAFQNGLMKAYTEQMRHENEVNSLIDELSSYKNSYQKNY